MTTQKITKWGFGEIKKRWGWYTAVLVIFGPFILASVVTPEWLGRLIGISLVYTGIPILLFSYAFGPQKSLGSEGKNIWPRYITDKFGERVYTGTRILIGLLAGVALYLLTVPLALDVLKVVQEGYLPHMVGTVSSIDGSSVAGYISQTVVFDSNVTSIPENGFYAVYFLLGTIKYGNTYEITYLPSTHIILSVKPTSQR